ncbi:MAG: serine aminopeptidase domain-containing protein [Aquabacterium sp.]
MTERTVIFGDDQHLIATLTPPSQTATPTRWVALLTNSGVIPRFGPHRMNVRLAQRFASMGVASIRYDMSGLGDSRRIQSQGTITEQWVRDTRAAMDQAQAVWGDDVRFFMIGFCSGAEVAHLTALEDKRLEAAVLWDFYAFPTWKSKLYKLLYKLRRAGCKGILRRLLRMTDGARATSGSGRSADDGLQGFNTGPVPPPDVYMRRFQQLADQKVSLFFYYSGGEPEWYAYRNQFFDMFEGQRFVSQVHFDQLAISDHLITTKPAQEGFTAAVIRWLESTVLQR